MSRIFYLAATRSQIERLLRRKLNPARETHVLNREQIAGFGKGSIIVFLEGWERSVDEPRRFEQEAMFRQLAGALVVDAPWDRPRQPEQQWGVSVPQMWARQAGKRLAMERAWVDQMKFASWDGPEPKRSPWHLWVTRIKVQWGTFRRRVAKWIAGNEWPDPW